MPVIRKFPGRINRWVDGDTCRVDIDQGFYDWKLNRELRLYGWDAPERRTNDEKERVLGNYARDLMEKTFPSGSEIVILSMPQEHGKYGRVIGSLENDKLSWELALKRESLIVPYGKFTKEELEPIWAERYDLLIKSQ